MDRSLNSAEAGGMKRLGWIIQKVRWKAVGSLGMVLLWAGCVAPPPVATPAMVGYAPQGSRLENLERGREILVGACARCHAVDPPDAFAPAKWKEIVSEMAERARISREQEADLIKYLLGARAWMGVERSSSGR